MKRSASEISSPKQQQPTSNCAEEQANKRRHFSPEPSLSTLDALPLHTIFFFLYNDLSSQLALYGTCANFTIFVKSEKQIPLNGVLQLKKFTQENPDISLITLHYRMCGLFQQYAWLHDYSIFEFPKLAKDLPQSLMEHCKNGLIQAVYAYRDEFYGGGFTYLEVAVKKVNSDEKISLKFSELKTIHGRDFQVVRSLDVSIDNTRVFNRRGITDLEALDELTQNAEICKEMKGIELLNSLFSLSMNEKKISKESRPSLYPTFAREHETIIDTFMSDVVDVKDVDSFSSICELVSITENLCRVKKTEEDVNEEEEITKDDEENPNKEAEFDLFEFVALVKHNINYLYYDGYSNYSTAYIDCNLKRKDNGEIVSVSVTAIVGPSYNGTGVELDMLVNGELALTFKMEEGSVKPSKKQDCFETFVESFKTSKNPNEFAADMLEFIIYKPKWAVYSLYDMENYKTGITTENGYPIEFISEVLEFFCEKTE